ncbi:MAG: tetratricopeptide repeat protein [Gemmatimonadales bacterium]
MPNIGYFHPEIVHFVIAGAGLGIFFRWLSLTGKLQWTNGAATALILIGAVAAWFAVQSGSDAHGAVERIPGVARAVQLHEDAGHDARNVLLLLAAFELVALVPALAKWRRFILAASAAIGVVGAYEIYNVGHLGGEIVYAYSGGVGIRSGDSTDVNRMVLAAMYDRAQLYRAQKNTEGAADAFAKLAAQFPADQSVQLLGVESLLQDKKDYAAALAALKRIPAPGDSDRTRTRYETDRADAFVGAGQTDSARAILTDLAKRFPTSKRIQDKLAKLK